MREMERRVRKEGKMKGGEKMGRRQGR